MEGFVVRKPFRMAQPLWITIPTVARAKLCTNVNDRNLTSWREEDMLTTTYSIPGHYVPNVTVWDAAGPKNWFAVYTRSHHEKRVAEHLAQREVESFLPLYRTVHSWSNHRKAVLDLPLFPNYLFVHIAPAERVRTLGIPGVLSVVSRGGAAAPLLDAEIEQLRSGLSLRRMEPHPHLAVGRRARIVKGPLAGLDGVVVRMKGSLRVVLTVALILQSVAVEADADELEQLS